MDWLVDVLKTIVEILKMGGGLGIVVTLFIFAVLMNYAVIVLLMNMKIVERRKQLAMDKVDDVAQYLFQFVKSKYFSLAKRELGEEVYYFAMETRLAAYNIWEAIEALKKSYLRRVRINGFENKTPAEWDKYVEDVIQADLNQFTKVVDAAYHPGATIPRPMWFAYNQTEVVPEAKHQIRHLLSELLAIAETHKLRRLFFWKPVL